MTNTSEEVAIVPITKKEEKALEAEYEAAYKNYTGSFPSFEQFLRMKQTKVRRG